MPKTVKAPEIPEYDPNPRMQGKPVKVRANGETHTIAFGEFDPTDLVIILRLQRGHGPGTSGWTRSIDLYNRWDAGKVLTIDVVTITLEEDTECLTIFGIQMIPAGTTVYHVMDGAHRLSAVWYATMFATENPERPGHINTRRQDVADTTFICNLYAWPGGVNTNDVVAKYFMAKNRDRTQVNRSDQLKMRINQNDQVALDIAFLVHEQGLVFPFETDAMKAAGLGGEAARLKREGYLITAVGMLENIYTFWARDGRLADSRIDITGAKARNRAVKGLRLTLAAADVLYPAAWLRSAGRQAASRWLGDWLLGLARVLQANSTFAKALQNDGSKAQRDVVLRMQRMSVKADKVGPMAWQMISGSVAANAGATITANEITRSYWVARAVVEEFNKGKRVGLLTPPIPLKAMPHEVVGLINGNGADDLDVESDEEDEQYSKQD